MSPNDILIKLETLGIKMTRRTLLNYEKWEIIPKPKRGGGGPGGRYTDYPEGTIEEVYAAWSLMRGKYGHNIKEDYPDNTGLKLSPELIAQARESEIYNDEMRELEELQALWDAKEGVEPKKLTDEERIKWFSGLCKLIRAQEDEELMNKYPDEFDRDAARASKEISGAFLRWVSILWKWQRYKGKYLLRLKASE